MGSVNHLKIIIEAEDEATEPIERVTAATRRLGDETKRTTKQSKKDWGGLGDLFGQVLPRNLQSLTRGFKGTQRQVGRLSKGFKALKAAWAAIGIGLIIIALELVIENWDKVSEALGFYNKEAATTAKINKKANDAVFQLTAQTKGYYKVLKDNESTEEQRALALQKLTGLVGDYVDKEADAATQQEQVLEIMAAREKLASAQAKTQERIALNEEALQKTTKAYAKENKGYLEDWWSFQTEQKVEQGKTRRAAEEATKDSIAAEVEYLELLGIATDREKERADALKSEEQLKREAEAARKKAIAEAASDAKWLANQRIQISQETELRLIQDEEQRELRSLEIQHEAAKEELALRGGTLLDKLALEQSYLMDKEAIENDYKDRAAEQTALDEQKAKDDAATLTEALATDQENEIQRARDKYAALQELAVVDSQESLDLAEQLGQEEEKINEKYEKIKRDAEIKTQNLKIQGMIKLANATRGILGSLSDMAEGNAEQQRKLAIVDILLSQAIAVGNAIAGATAAGMGTGIAAPLTTPIFIAQMVGSVLASFAGIKGILSKAGASMPSGGGGSSGGGRGGGISNVQVPLPARLDTPDSMQAYVVQSQLQGQMNAQGRLDSQIIL